MDQSTSLVEYGSRRVIITLTAIICALLEIVDTTIVNVALNDMQGNLGATTSEVGWVVTMHRPQGATARAKDGICTGCPADRHEPGRA